MFVPRYSIRFCQNNSPDWSPEIPGHLETASRRVLLTADGRDCAIGYSPSRDWRPQRDPLQTFVAEALRQAKLAGLELRQYLRELLEEAIEKRRLK